MADSERVDQGWGLKPKTLSDFLHGAQQHHHTMLRMGVDTYRLGQAYFNYFEWHFGPVVNEIVATDTDPFHNDHNIGRMLTYVVDEGLVSV